MGSGHRPFIFFLSMDSSQSVESILVLKELSLKGLDQSFKHLLSLCSRVDHLSCQLLCTAVNECVECTANEGPVRIQYKYLVPSYVFPEMKLRGLVISKQNYNVIPPNLHIPRIGLPT